MRVHVRRLKDGDYKFWTNRGPLNPGSKLVVCERAGRGLVGRRLKIGEKTKVEARLLLPAGSSVWVFSREIRALSAYRKDKDGNTEVGHSWQHFLFPRIYSPGNLPASGIVLISAVEVKGGRRGRRR